MMSDYDCDFLVSVEITNPANEISQRITFHAMLTESVIKIEHCLQSLPSGGYTIGASFLTILSQGKMYTICKVMLLLTFIELWTDRSTIMHERGLERSSMWIIS